MNPRSTVSMPAPAIRPAADAFLAPMDVWSDQRPRLPVRDMGQDPLATDAIRPGRTNNSGTRGRWVNEGGLYPSLAILSIQYGRLVTMSVYGHVSPGMQAEAANAFAKLMAEQER